MNRGGRDRGGARQQKHAASSGESQTTTDNHLTDLGNARRLVKRHGMDMRFCHPFKRWFVWDGSRWHEDETGAADRLVKETQGELYRSTVARIEFLSDLVDENYRKAQLSELTAILKHALRLEDARDMARCLKSASSEPGIPVLPNQLDRDPMLLNVLNGTIDLRTGTLREHRREDLLTKLAPVSYDPNATCPRWLQFLDRIMEGNDDLIAYLQRVVGYALTGDVSEQCLWFFHGTGANGKSTFLSTIMAMLGDYGMQAVSDLLMTRKNESHPTERADLCGRRFVATIETEEGKRMAEVLMKQLTGGDRIRARKMRQDFFEIEPTWKIFLAANDKPVMRGADYANWRRIKLVPFAVTISPDEKDKDLPVKLKSELHGILAWAIRGCLDWQKHGLGEPDEVRQATENYRDEQDTLQGFIRACCSVLPEARIQASKLFEAYQDWSGDRETTQKAFTQKMETKGFLSKPGTGNRRFFHGLRLPGTGGS
jgi:putative DNA primase/helicase